MYPWSIVAIILVVAIDQLSKATIRSITLNEVGAFSLPVSNAASIGIATAFVLLFLALFVYARARLTRIQVYGTALIIAGGLSNLIDRLVIGGVREIVNLPTIAFNIADVSVVGGAIVLIISTLSQGEKRLNRKQ